MDVRAENGRRPHQKVRFSMGPVMGRNFWTTWRFGIRVRKDRKVYIYAVFFPENQKNPRVRAIFVRNSVARNGCANLWAPGKIAFFLQENLHAHEIPRRRGGGFGVLGGGVALSFPQIITNTAATTTATATTTTTTTLLRLFRERRDQHKHSGGVPMLFL